MHLWARRQKRMGDDPPFLTVGTEVSAKYKGAFCEAKVRKVVRSVKCKVTFKLGLGTISITDDQIRGGTLRVGSVCEVKHPEKKEFVEAIINKIQDCSQYTVVFDDGDITTLRRTALCLKSGRHFAESETLDQLPLTHPEHFSNPVIGGRKGRRSRQAQEETSDEEDPPKKGKKKEEKEADIGKVVCVELGDKKKQKDNWFPGLVVAPTAQDTVRIRVKDEYLVRSFKDGRYFTVPKKEATEFTREIGNKVDNHTLKAAVEKALQYLDRDELPPHWDRDLLFGLDESSGNSDSDGALDSDSSDDEPREEKDHFVAQLYKFMDDRGTPINKGPTIGSRDVDLYKLFKVVHKLGGYNRVTNHNQWKTIAQKLGFGQGNSSITNLVKQSYKKFLHSFEDFYRKLGCTMVNHPRGHRSRHRTGRSLIRDRDRTTPTIVAKDKEKKEEKTTPAPEKQSSEGAEKESSSSKPSVAPENKKEEEKPREEEKKEETKQKEPTKKSKTREDKTETQSKQKGKEEKAGESSQTETEEKDNRSRSKKETKTSDTKVPRLFEDLEKEETDTAPEEVPEQEPEVTEETKSRESKSKTRETKAKEKSKASSEKSKIKEEKVKVPDEEKNEDSKKKTDKKAPVEEDEKHTRAKAKEDTKNKKESGSTRENQRETRTPVRDASNRTPVRSKEMPRKEEEGGPGNLKKRGRKRKETEEKAKAEESMGHLASHVSVCVGDKLKVYYGPTHESKVTYEAKVLDIEEDGSECMYLVHYTGWNTRYDEWIKRGRIADNLSWTPSRAKRQRQQQSQHKTSRLSQGKRGRPSLSGRSQEGVPNPPRSTTPSSVTSSSSRTKSPATRTTPRSGRSAGDSASPGHEFRRRTRRSSGHTDISMASDSETEEFESEAEPESEMAQTRSRTTEQRRSATAAAAAAAAAAANSSATAAPTPQPVPDKDDHPPPPNIPKEEPIRRAGATRKKTTGSGKKKDPPAETTRAVTSADEEEEEEKKPVVEPLPNTEKRRSKRGKSSPAAISRSSPQRPKLTPEIKADVKAELSAGTESEEDIAQPKGRDFDLNEIRSELKGIEKAVKSPLDLTPPPPLPGEVADDEDEGDDEEEEEEVVEETIKPKEEQEEKTEVKQESKSTGKGSSAIAALFADIDDDDEEEEEEEEVKVKPKELVCEVPAASASKPANSSLLMVEEEEDVYEFKEPEPFEFEVRKGERLLLDSKGLTRRPGITSSRIYELPVSAPDPPPPPLLTGGTTVLATSLPPSRFTEAKSPRKRHMRTPPKDATTEGSKKIRRASQKKLATEVTKTVTEIKDEKSASNTLPPQAQSSIPEQVPIPSPLVSYSSRPTSSIELSFEKLCTTETSSLATVAILSSTSQMVKPSLGGRTLIVTSPIPSSSIDENPVSPPLLSLPDDDDDDDEARKSSELGPLSIFSQVQDDDGDDDHEDRLVISESDDMVTEIAEPLFSYQQRDHEDIFPTLVTSAAVVTAAEGTDSCKSDDPPCLSPVVAPTSLFQGFTSPLREPSDISLGANVGSTTGAVITQGRLSALQHQPQHKQQAQQPPQLQQQKLLPQHFQPLQLEIASQSKQLLEPLQHSKKHLEPLQMPKQHLESFQLPKLQLELSQTVKQQLEISQMPKTIEHTEIPKLVLEPPQPSKLFVDEPQLSSPLLEQPIPAKKLGEIVSKQEQEQPLFIKQQQEQVQIIKLSPEQAQSTKVSQEQPQELTSMSKQLEHCEEQSLLLKPQQEQALQQDLQPTSLLKPRSPIPNEADRRTKSSSPVKSQSPIVGSPNESRPGEDEIKDLLKHQEDDDEDDSINAAIQRALDRSIIDEDDEETTGAMELFGSKETLTPVESSDPVPSGANAPSMAPQKDSPQSSASPGHSTGSTTTRKRVACVSLGSAFFDSDDSAADSSDDEGQRLIIDPMEDEGSSQPRSCSSPLSSSELRLHISEDDVEPCPADTEDDADMDTALEDELRTEDEETIEEAAIVITRNASPTLAPDDNSSTSEAVISGPIVTEEDTLEADELPSGTLAEEEMEDEDTLVEAPCSRLSLHSEDAPIDVSECDDTVAPVMTPVIVKVDLEDTTKMAEAEILSGGVVVLDASPELSAPHGIDQSLGSSSHTAQTTVVTATIVASSPSDLNPQNPTPNIVCEATATSEASPILALAAVPLGEAEAAEIRQETRSDDADSQLLGSLLCQETIPGSPAQAGEGVSEDHIPESKVLVLEMPFASVPASSCDATGSTMSLPVPISVPLNIPVVTSASAATTPPASTATAVVAAEVLTSVAVTVSGVEVPANEEVPAAAAAPTGPAQHLHADPSPGVSKLNSNHAATVMENTPPTTPDSTLSTMSNSPREMLGDMSPPSPPMDNESSKSHRDSFEMDVDSCQEGAKVDHFSEDDSLLNVEVSNSCDNRLQGLKLVPKKNVLDLDKDHETSPKKRRRSRKRSESESNKRARCSSGRNTRTTGGTGSDSDDTSENSALGCTPMASSESTLSSKSPRPSKYNFYVELDPELDGSQRIALLQQKLQELRKTYISVKAELACIDRRRKKLRRREREVEKATKQEVACS